AAIGANGASIDAGQPLDQLLAAAASAFKGTLLIILDQFEEYLLYYSADRRSEFESQFARAVNREDVDANFLLSLREDWLSKLDLFRSRLPHLLRNVVHLRNLDAAAAEEAIRKPLSVHNQRNAPADRVQIEDDLVRAVIDQAQSGDGRVEADSPGIRTPLL